MIAEKIEIDMERMNLKFFKASKGKIQGFRKE